MNQVNVAPRCPKCGSLDCRSQRVKAMTLEHRGQPHRASKQYRQCKKCGEWFTCILIKEPITTKKRRSTSGPWAEKPEPEQPRSRLTDRW
jgi:predicted nucleic-acid-binding Zn-ribbon protein